ncbi:hypothetical protein [Paracoccus sanguinis]|uniref:hypothetical protein n=1 Tax=Paracoccus sanguinis TaxID=1545044 RepID=UPI00051FE774|nr:hypothetical protein [Paracoccus sanguinis]KGJ13600.1 hypothetical protein IX54_11110 [Paracoccus sanguinis]
MFDADPAVNPSLALWQAVLLRQVDDALSGVEGSNGESRQVRLKMIRQARAFLTTMSDDLTELCSLAGMDAEAVIIAMRDRIAEAPTPEELVEGKPRKDTVKNKPERPKRIARTLTHNGETLTVREWAARIGVTPHTIHVRLTAGWDVADAVTTTHEEAQHRARQAMQRRAHAPTQRTWSRGSPAKRLTHNGQTLTIREWSEITGIKIGTIKRRIAAGMDMASVLNPNRNPRRDTL